MGKLRRQVWKRDRGICAICLLDAEHLCTLLAKPKAKKDQKAIAAVRRLLKIGKRKTLWDADHIVPIIRGGGDELENMRTLCLWCHKTETSGIWASRKLEWGFLEEKREEEPSFNQYPKTVKFLGGPKDGVTRIYTDLITPHPILFAEDVEGSSGEWHIVRHLYLWKRETEDEAIYGYSYADDE